MVFVLSIFSKSSELLYSMLFIDPVGKTTLCSFCITTLIFLAVRGY
ncbi:ACD_00300 [African swine fever virus]